MEHSVEDAAVSAYWDALRDAAVTAERRAPAIERHLGIAGQRVTLRAAGDALLSAVLPALAHLLIGSVGDPDLTVLLSDTASTGVDLPPLPWQTIPNEAWSLQTERFSALHLPVLNSVLWFDREERTALYWLPDAAQCPIVERGSPLLTLWAWWLADRGMQLTHGAAIGGSQGAALLAGPGGSGKSTTALMCAGGPLRYLADDYCIVDPQMLTVHSLYCSGKVALADHDRFPHLQRFAAGHDDEKTLYLFHPSDPPIVERRLPLIMLLAPTVTGRSTTTIERIPTMAAVRATAPSTVLQLRTGHPGDALKRITTLASRIPCYKLELGTNFDGIRDLLQRLLN